MTTLLDSFSRPDSPTLGANWTELLGGFSIASDYALASSNVQDLATFNGYDLVDTALSVTLGFSSATPPAGVTEGGVALRVNGSGAGISGYVVWTVFTLTPLPEITVGLGLMQGSAVTQIGSGGMSFDPGFKPPIAVELTAVGSLLTVYVNDSQVCQVTDTTLSCPGGIGIYALNNHPAQFQNFSAILPTAGSVASITALTYPGPTNTFIPERAEGRRIGPQPVPTGFLEFAEKQRVHQQSGARAAQQTQARKDRRRRVLTMLLLMDD